MDIRRLYLALTLLVIVIALAACGSVTSQEEPTPTPILQTAASKKPTYVVEQGTITQELKFTARIAPVQEDQLFFRTDGRISTINVQQGDKVKKGDVLAELDMADLLNQEAQAEITLQTAQLKLKAAEQNVNDQRIQAESALRTARLKLEQAKIKDPTPNVEIAKANLEKAAVALQSAQAAYDQKKDRPNIAMLPESLNLQKATIDYDIAKAQYDLAVQSQKSWEYDILLLQEAVTVAEANLQKLTTAIDPALSQDVAKAQLAVDRLKNQIASGRIIATFDGEVTSVSATAGRTVNAYKPVITIAAEGAQEVSADLVSSTIQDLSVGQKCTLTMSNYPSKTFNGVIRRLPATAFSASALEEDRSTRISILDADVPLERGALVRVSVILQQKDNVLWVPPDAVRTFQGKDFVLVQDGETQRRVPVKVGIKTEDRVEIESGLSLGQIVIGQ